MGEATLSTRMHSLRAFSFPLTILPIAIATISAVSFSLWKVDIFVLSVLGAVLLHAIGNLLNDYFDFKSGVDRKIEGDDDRPGRFLVRGELTPRDILVEVAISIALLIPTAGYIIMKCGMPILWFGLIGLAGAVIYTAPPFNLKYHAMGEPLILLIFGPLLMVGAAFAQTGTINMNVLFVSLPAGIATMAVLLGNNIRDIDEDREAKIKTIAHVIGKKSAIRFFRATLLLPQILTVILVTVGIIPLWTLLTLISLVPAIGLIQKTVSDERIPDIDARTAQSSTLYFILLFTGLSISALLQ